MYRYCRSTAVQYFVYYVGDCLVTYVRARSLIPPSALLLPPDIHNSAVGGAFGVLVGAGVGATGGSTGGGCGLESKVT